MHQIYNKISTVVIVLGCSEFDEMVSYINNANNKTNSKCKNNTHRNYTNKN